MGEGPVNIYGRQGGRGVRPWLLVPKVLAVGLFFGGLAGTFVLSSALHPRGDAEWRSLGYLLGLLFRFVLIPGSTLAVVLGILLVLQAPRVLLAQRWLQVKLAVLLVALPAVHLVARANLHYLKTWQSGPGAELITALGPDQEIQMIRWSVGAGLVVVAVVVFLARVKPRLGQNWARTYQRLRQ